MSSLRIRQPVERVASLRWPQFVELIQGSTEQPRLAGDLGVGSVRARVEPAEDGSGTGAWHGLVPGGGIDSSAPWLEGDANTTGPGATLAVQFFGSADGDEPWISDRRGIGLRLLSPEGDVSPELLAAQWYVADGTGTFGPGVGDHAVEVRLPLWRTDGKQARARLPPRGFTQVRAVFGEGLRGAEGSAPLGEAPRAQPAPYGAMLEAKPAVHRRALDDEQVARLRSVFDALVAQSWRACTVEENEVVLKEHNKSLPALAELEGWQPQWRCAWNMVLHHLESYYNGFPQDDNVLALFCLAALGLAYKAFASDEECPGLWLHGDRAASLWPGDPLQQMEAVAYLDALERVMWRDSGMLPCFDANVAATHETYVPVASWRTRSPTPRGADEGPASDMEVDDV